MASTSFAPTRWTASASPAREAGTRAGIGDLEQSIAIAVAGNSLESVRGYANLGNAMVENGELARAFKLYQQGRDAASRFGDVDRILWFEVERMYEWYWCGSWDEAQRLADEIVPRWTPVRPRLGAGRAAGAGSYQAGPWASRSRSTIRLGRSSSGAMRVPEMLVPPWRSRHGWCSRRARRRGSALADELMWMWPKGCPTSYWVSDLAFTLRGADRPDALATAARSAPAASRWLDAGLALAAGDAAGAAEKYVEIGCLPDQATALMFAARAALAAGGRAAAEAQLRQALETFRQLAATRYLREAEALMAIPA